MSHQATKQWQGKTLIEELAAKGIIIRCPSMRGVAEEAPLAYKDVSVVVDIADRAGLSRKVARLEPVICIIRVMWFPKNIPRVTGLFVQFFRSKKILRPIAASLISEIC